MLQSLLPFTEILALALASQKEELHCFYPPMFSWETVKDQVGEDFGWEPFGPSAISGCIMTGCSVLTMPRLGVRGHTAAEVTVRPPDAMLVCKSET